MLVPDLSWKGDRRIINLTKFQLIPINTVSKYIGTLFPGCMKYQGSWRGYSLFADVGDRNLLACGREILIRETNSVSCVKRQFDTLVEIKLCLSANKAVN